MRFHRLTMEGVGSFAHREVVDFDALGSQGLFLIHGDTGAGKSTILDALFCALYGSVPGGSENNERRMVSWYLPPKTKPRLTLDFSVGNKFYRLTRTLWSYNELGEKLSNYHAATLEVSVKPDFCEIDETISGVNAVADRVVRILGLESKHFEQTVMLPQGKAQEFLTANGTERYGVLKSLFKSEIYSDLEEAAKARQKQGADESKQYNAAQLERLSTLVSGLVNNPVLEGCGIDLDSIQEALHPKQDGKKGWQPRVFDTLYSQVKPQLDQVKEFIANQSQHTRQQLEEAQKLADKAADDFSEAKATFQKIQAAHALQDQLQVLEARTEEIANLREENAQAARAATVITAADNLQSPQLQASQKVAELSSLVQQILSKDPVLSNVQAQGLDLVADTKAWLSADSTMDFQHSASWKSWFKRARELVQSQGNRLQTVAGELTQCHQQAEINQGYSVQLGELTQEQAKLLSQQDNLRKDQDTARAKLEQAQQLAAARVGLAEQKQESDKALEQARDLERLQKKAQKLSQSVATNKQAVKSQARLVKQALDAWIAADAPRLAETLVPGEPCPVCGSCAHPHPATSRGTVADYAEFESGSARLEELQAKLQESEKQLSTLNGEIQNLEKILAGQSRQDLEKTNQDLHTRLQAATQAQQDLEKTQIEVQSLEKQLQDVLATTLELEKSLAATRANLETGEVALRQLQAAIKADLGEKPGEVSVEDYAAKLLRHNQQSVQTLEHIDAIYQEWLTARERWLTRQEQLQQALRENGYDAVTAARDDFKPEKILESDCATVSQWETDMASTKSKLEVLRDLLNKKIPDMRVLEQAQLAAKQKLSDLQSLEKDLALVSRKFEESLAGIAAKEAAWVESSKQIATLNELVAALSGNNPKGPSLSSAYLSTRLKQVIEIANDTVKDISNGYLEMSFTSHSLDDRSRSKEGLGINIYNAAEDSTTSPLSLSGGEKFYCSLAIALALSAVVQAERGGVELDNIFIDEGFGSLDDTTRDIVISTLKRLYQDSKRSVGIISHVNELKADIPLQLEVKNYRSGSGSNRDAVKKGSYLQVIGLE